eukprot:12403251-Karenia_brevis.AAC.1
MGGCLGPDPLRCFAAPGVLHGAMGPRVWAAHYQASFTTADLFSMQNTLRTMTISEDMCKYVKSECALEKELEPDR